MGAVFMEMTCCCFEVVLMTALQGGVPAPGHITAYVRVPLRVVGLVVGPKGATIKRIQQDTHTYIITPSREREPIFEVSYYSPGSRVFHLG